MNEEKIQDKFEKLMDELHQSTLALREMLANHETRITVLETKKDSGWQSQLLMLLAKAVLIGGVAIASLTGAGSLIKGIFGL